MHAVIQPKQSFYDMTPEQQDAFLQNFSGLVSDSAVEPQVEVSEEREFKVPAPVVRTISPEVLQQRVQKKSAASAKVVCGGCKKQFVPVRPGLPLCPPCHKQDLAKQEEAFELKLQLEREAHAKRRRDAWALEQGVNGWCIPADAKVEQVGDTITFTLGEAKHTLSERSYRKEMKERLRHLVRAAWDMGGEQAVVEAFGHDVDIRNGPMVTILIPGSGESVTVPPKVKVDTKAIKKRNHEANLARRREEDRSRLGQTGKKK